MKKKLLGSILCLFISLNLCTYSFIGILPTASAQETWKNVFSLSKTVEIPPGEEYFAYFDEDMGTIMEMMLPSLEAGLSQKAKLALTQIPDWLYGDLAKKFAELGDTTIDIGDFATPVFADMDGDGDFDLSVGSQEGKPYYFENVGTRYRPIFIMDTEMYSYIYTEYLPERNKTSLAIADLDADGDNDLLIGNDLGVIFYLENIGSSTQPVWGPCYVADNILVSGNSHPTLADLDNDGDCDLAVGSSDGFITFYENIGSSESALWEYDYRVYTGEQDDRTVSLADMDDDGDFDLTIGDGDFATLYYHRNVGSSSQELWATDPIMYTGVSPEYGTSPAIADLNGDGRLDLVVGGFSGGLFYYRNIGTASNPQWLIWSFYQIIEGYMYYPKEVFTKYRSDYWMDIYADLILNAASRYRDEIGFAIAHTPIENLKAMNQNQTQLFVDNAHLIYEIDLYLDYVEVIEKGDYTTTRYKVGEPGNITQRELPRDIYYWYIVHPKITDEKVFYVHPDDSDPTHPTDPADGGRFWREYLFFHADDSYPPDTSGYPNDGYDDYPAPGISPPLLKDLLEGIEVFYNGTTWFAPAGNYTSFKETGKDNIRPFTYGNHAVVRVSNWVGKTLILNQQEVTDDERPLQPVRIAHHHNGNCGELQDLTVAAARCALIPAAGALLLGEDHVWSEFYENGWHQWDNYWSDGGSVIDNFNTYWVGWGERSGSGVWKMGGDDDTWEVTDHYIPEEDLSYVTVRVVDINGDPVDGARVVVITYWLTVDIEGYQISVPFPAIWNYTDSNGETLFKLATQTRANGNHNFTFKIISKVGSTQSGKLELDHGQDYTFTFTLEGSAPNPELNTNELPDPSPLNPEYRLGIDYQVKSGVQFPMHPETGNYHPEEIPPERTPESPVYDFSGNHIDSFMTPEQEFYDFMKGYNFDSYEYAQNSNSDAFEFDLPDGNDWYFVMSNRDSIETTKVVDLSLNLYFKLPPNSVKILNPCNGAELNVGDIITISGYVTNESELLSLKLSTDGGINWTYLSWIDNNWSYNWDTSFLSPGLYTIEVIADFQSITGSDAIEVELIDNEPPFVDIINPIEDSKYNIGQTIIISGSAYDNIEIKSLELSTDGGNSWIDILSSLSGGQWWYSWTTEGLLPDNYVIVIQASDGYQDGLDSRYVELVDMDPPSVSIFKPTENSRINVGTIFMITGEAKDNSRVSSLRISTDGGQNWVNILMNLDDTTWFYEWATAGLPLGYRSIKVKASDGTYNATFLVEIEMVDTEGPIVTITYPVENSQINIGSTILISGSAIDNLGIQKLKLSTNGGKTWTDVLPSLNNDRWAYEWDTKGCSIGMYVLKIKAWDGQYEELDYIFVELVDTISPKLTITSPAQNQDFNCGEKISVSGTTSDNQGITELKLSTDNGDTWIDILQTLNNGNWYYEWDTTILVPDLYTITVSTSDGVNPQVFAKVECTLIDADMPILEITAPIEDLRYDVGDAVIFEGRATDNLQISVIQISMDNGDNWTDILYSLDDRGRWTYIWDTEDFKAGTYEIRIKISDGNNEVEKSLTIVLVEEEEEEEVNFVSMMFSPLFLIIILVIVLAIISAVVYKTRPKSEEIVVVEEMRY